MAEEDDEDLVCSRVLTTSNGVVMAAARAPETPPATRLAHKTRDVEGVVGWPAGSSQLMPDDATRDVEVGSCWWWRLAGVTLPLLLPPMRPAGTSLEAAATDAESTGLVCSALAAAEDAGDPAAAPLSLPSLRANVPAAQDESPCKASFRGGEETEDSRWVRMGSTAHQ